MRLILDVAGQQERPSPGPLDPTRRVLGVRLLHRQV